MNNAADRTPGPLTEPPDRSKWPDYQTAMAHAAGEYWVLIRASEILGKRGWLARLTAWRCRKEAGKS